MNIEKYDFENQAFQEEEKNLLVKSESEINAKYEKGYSRVVTEQGSYKLSLIKELFESDNYQRRPKYQRRITWNNKKKSKLIESFIINIPVPPIFLYEYDYDKYEIMDGLQRITTIIDFYSDSFKLSGLEEWSELNGKKYSQLPKKIREGIDRRAIQMTILLKETAQDSIRAEKIKRLVFERLNTGGEELKGQEIRNALYNGKGNDLCMQLSENNVFRKLWGMPYIDEASETDNDETEIDNAVVCEIDEVKLNKHSLYRRMFDVEIVLRYFAMRDIEHLHSLSSFLDETLIKMNKYDDEDILVLKETFEKTIDKANKLFGEMAFREASEEKWSSPKKMIYDAMMLVLSQSTVIVPEVTNQEENINKLQEFYMKSKQKDLFDGKHQDREDILRRAEACGSTVVVLFIYKGKYGIVYAGDSRCYIFEHGQLLQITIDEVWENQTGLNYWEKNNRHHPNRGKLINAVGIRPDIQCKIITNEIISNSVFLLCSDGLHKMCPEQYIKKCLKKCKFKKNIKLVLDKLINKVYQNGAKDNISILLVRCYV